MAAANVAVGSAADTEHVVQERFEAFIMGCVRVVGGTARGVGAWGLADPTR